MVLAARSKSAVPATALFILLLCLADAVCAWSGDPANPTLLCAAEGKQRLPALVKSADAFIAAWWDQRRGSCGYNCVYTDVYAQRLNLQGDKLWTDQGRVVAAGPGNALVYPSQLLTGLAPDGKGGAIVAWNDQAGVSAQGYATHLAADAKVAWGDPGIAIQDPDSAVSMPLDAAFSDRWDFAADSEGGIFVALPAGAQIARFDAAGRLRTTWFQDSAMRYRVAIVPVVEPSGEDAVIAVWINGNGYFVNSVMAQKLLDPEASWPVAPDTLDPVWGHKTLYEQAATFSAWRLSAVSDDAGGVIAAWVDNRGGTYRVYAQRVDAEGNLRWGAAGTAVSGDVTNANYWAFNLALAPDGAGGVVIAWNEPYASPHTVRAQRLSADGRSLWDASGVVVATGTVPYSPYLSGVIRTQEDNFVLLYHSESTEPPVGLIAQKLSAGQGELLWDAGRTVYEGCFSTYYEKARLVSDGLGGAVIAFGACDGNVYAQRVRANRPLLSVLANGTADWISVPSGEEISVEVELTPFDWVDNPADWWVAAQTSAGWYRYDYQTKLWLFAGADPLSLTPTYQGALFELPSITVLQASSLPKGQYAIYFAVDMQMNGKLDLNTLYSSVVSVEVRD